MATCCPSAQQPTGRTQCARLFLLRPSAKNCCVSATPPSSRIYGNGRRRSSKSPTARPEPKSPAGACCAPARPIPFTPGSIASSNTGSAAFRSDQDAGASPLFPPRHSQPAEAKEALLHLVRRDPRALGVERTRWTLPTLLTTCDWLALTTPSSLGHLLRRLDIAYKRGRDYVHSPDPDYLAKLALARERIAEARASGGRVVTLYQDELTYNRQPTLARAYEARGRPQPLARRSYRTDTATRTLGTLDVSDGRVLFWQGAHIELATLVRFYQALQRAYPDAERLYLIQDNWPQHFHPDVLVALEPQENPWPWYRPSNWPTEPSPTAQRRFGSLRLPIQLVPLPTYASWTNPIEKLWRKLKAEVLHLHRLADRLDELREQVAHFLEQFAQGSLSLLHYVGLSLPD